MMKLSIHSILLLIALIFVSTSASETEKECATDGTCFEDPSCPSRPHIVKCAAKYLDTNQNDKLEREELEVAIAALPFLARGVLKIIGSVDKIMAKCDADGDGAIGIETDMPNTEETCLATCFKRKAFKAAFFPECDL